MTIIVDGQEVRLQFETREDGGLRIWSDQVPCLALSSKDPAKVLSDVEPVLRAMFQYGLEIKI